MKKASDIALILILLLTMTSCGINQPHNSSSTEPITSNDSEKETQSEFSNEEVDYSIFTDIRSSEVQSFAEGIQADIANDDWASLSKKIIYPITVGSTTLETADEFKAYDIGSLLTDDFRTAIAQTDCSHLSANWQGARTGNGEIWIAECLDDNFNSLGLKIIAINTDFNLTDNK